MPSPVGHALGGVAFGWLIGGVDLPANRLRQGFGGQEGGSHEESGTREEALSLVASAFRRKTQLRAFALFATLGMLPDIDFVFGTHSTYTHSVGASAAIGLVALIWSRGNMLFALAAAASYGSHVLLDWLGSDATPPIGIMALWPFTSDFYQSNLHVFMAVSRRYWMNGFWWHNLTAVAWEIGILGPVAVITWWARVKSPARRRRDSDTESVTSAPLL